MKKALLTSNNASIKQANKRKYIKGGDEKYSFEIDNTTTSNNIIKIIATNSAAPEKKSYITYFTKGKGNLDEKDIEDKTLNIITANLTETNYYATIGNITDYKKFIANINLFDTCVIVKLSNDNIYVFLKVEKKSSNIALTSFDTYQTNENNISQTDATMIKKFKSLGLDIDFVNKFVAGVKGYIDGQKGKIDKNLKKKKDEEADIYDDDDHEEHFVDDDKRLALLPRREAIQPAIQPAIRPVSEPQQRIGLSNGGKQGYSKKINTNKILNNLILKLSKINNVKKPTKPNATKSTKPKPKAPKPTKPKPKPKATKSKPKVTKSKPKVTKPKATKK